MRFVWMVQVCPKKKIPAGMTEASREQLQPREQQLHHTPIPGEELDTQARKTLFSQHHKDMKEGKKKQADKLFFFIGEKKEYVFHFWLSFLPFAPSSRGKRA